MILAFAPPAPVPVTEATPLKELLAARGRACEATLAREPIFVRALPNAPGWEEALAEAVLGKWVKIRDVPTLVPDPLKRTARRDRLRAERRRAWEARLKVSITDEKTSQEGILTAFLHRTVRRMGIDRMIALSDGDGTWGTTPAWRRTHVPEMAAEWPRAIADSRQALATLKEGDFPAAHGTAIPIIQFYRDGYWRAAVVDPDGKELASAYDIVSDPELNERSKAWAKIKPDGTALERALLAYYRDRSRGTLPADVMTAIRNPETTEPSRLGTTYGWAALGHAIDRPFIGVAPEIDSAIALESADDSFGTFGAVLLFSEFRTVGGWTVASPRADADRIDRTLLGSTLRELERERMITRPMWFALGAGVPTEMMGPLWVGSRILVPSGIGYGGLGTALVASIAGMRIIARMPRPMAERLLDGGAIPVSELPPAARQEIEDRCAEAEWDGEATVRFPTGIGRTVLRCVKAPSADQLQFRKKDGSYTELLSASRIGTKLVSSDPETRATFPEIIRQPARRFVSATYRLMLTDARGEYRIAHLREARHDREPTTTLDRMPKEFLALVEQAKRQPREIGEPERIPPP